MTDVMARVQKHYDRAVKHYGEENVLGVFLYGSWNYNTSTPDSDVDTKCILVPNLYHLAIAPYEVKHLAVDDEVCECMTIMHMVANWKKQNINFIEIMFTDYCIINPMYKSLWEGLLPMTLREGLARYDLKQAVHSMTHQAIHTMRQNPNDGKKYMNGVRILTTLQRLIETNAPYKDCIWMPIEVRDLRFEEPDRTDVERTICLLEWYLEDIDKLSDDRVMHKHVVNGLCEKLIIQLIEHRLILD